MRLIKSKIVSHLLILDHERIAADERKFAAGHARPVSSRMSQLRPQILQILATTSSATATASSAAASTTTATAA